MARPSLDEVQILEQRNRLTAAALTLYRAQGYEAVTLRSLAAQLDMSHVRPYRYFKSKDELFAAIRTEVYTHFAGHLENAVSPDDEPIMQLRSICLAVVNSASRFPADYRLIFSLRQPAVSDYPQLYEVRLRSMGFMVSICQLAIDKDQLKGDATTWAHMAWASIHGLLGLHVANLLVVGRELDELVEPLLHALLPAATNNQPENLYELKTLK